MLKLKLLLARVSYTYKVKHFIFMHHQFKSSCSHFIFYRLKSFGLSLVDVNYNIQIIKIKFQWKRYSWIDTHTEKTLFAKILLISQQIPSRDPPLVPQRGLFAVNKCSTQLVREERRERFLLYYVSRQYVNKCLLPP